MKKEYENQFDDIILESIKDNNYVNSNTNDNIIDYLNEISENIKNIKYNTLIIALPIILNTIVIIGIVLYLLIK